jgi:UDP-glucuronate 4-epimerase
MAVACLKRTYFVNILITGVAGFIGSALALRLLERGDAVSGIDNLNDYYDVGLKTARLERCRPYNGFLFTKLDITDRAGMADYFHANRFDVVVHLAAQAGVRHSIRNPNAYIDANLVGFAQVLEGCRNGKVGHLVFASSSSVYGANNKLPFSEHDNVDHPVSLYAATKKANELMAHSYAHLYGLPCTGLRYFTVYGPWGRPDMALFKFTKGILEGMPIPVFNHGKMIRDFTYIDDVVDGTVAAIGRVPAATPGSNTANPDPVASHAPYRIYNIGNHRPVELMQYIRVLEQCLGRQAVLEMLPMQEGDVPATYADIADLSRDTGFQPVTPIEIGVARFVEWYKAFHRVA